MVLVHPAPDLHLDQTAPIVLVPMDYVLKELLEQECVFNVIQDIMDQTVPNVYVHQMEFVMKV